MFEYLSSWFMSMGINEETAVLVTRAIGLLLIFILSLVGTYLTKSYLLKLVRYSVEKTDTELDDIFYQQSVFSQLANIVPAIIIILSAPFIFGGSDRWVSLVTNLALIYIIIVGFLTINAFLNGVLDVYRSYEWSKDFPIRGFLQVFKVIFVLVATLLIASIVSNQSVLYILGTLGAATAVLMLIFQHPLLSLVAGIQLVANKMIARDDWISMPEFDAEGTVIDIALTTIKVQNADKSITMIPTQALINQSFKNWRGMEEAGGRQLKRALYIDLFSVRPYAEIASAELNQIMQLISVKPQNGPYFETNLAAFRAYALAYLRKHPQIHQEGFTHLVRALPPADHGVPIELYVYSSEMDWAKFEDIQAEIIEHLLVMLPQFGLRPFQNPLVIK